MTKELEEKIFNEFPKLFTNKKDLSQSLMWFGMECDDGWFDIIYNLIKKIDKIAKKEGLYNKEYPIRILQIKEKFGTLRVYMGGGTDEIFNLLDKAERKSSNTCEVCGKPGKLMGCAWVKTLCNDCGIGLGLKKFKDFIKEVVDKN